MKKVKIILSAILIAALAAIPVLAAPGHWMQNDYGYWWQRDDGSYPAAAWRWIDGNGDGVAECYHFDSNGYLDMDTVVEGYYVDEDGAWSDNGVKHTTTTGIEETFGAGPSAAPAAAENAASAAETFAVQTSAAETFTAETPAASNALPAIDTALEGNYEMHTEMVDSLIHIENGRDGQPHLYFQMYGTHEDGSSAERLHDFLLEDLGAGQSNTVHHFLGREANGAGAMITFDWMRGMDRLDYVVLNGEYLTSYYRQSY